MGPILSYPRNVSKQIQKKRSSADISIFLPEISKFCYIDKDRDCILIHNFWVFQLFHDVTKKIMTCSNFIEHLVLWPKFGKSIGISMREVIIKDLIRKTTFFERWSWLKFNNLELAVGTALKFHTSCGKRVKTQSPRVLGANPTFLDITEEKLVVAPPPPFWIVLEFQKKFLQIEKKRRFTRSLSEFRRNRKKIITLKLIVFGNVMSNLKAAADDNLSFFNWSFGNFFPDFLKISAAPSKIIIKFYYNR